MSDVVGGRQGKRFASLIPQMQVEILRLLYLDKKIPAWTLIRSTLVVDLIDKYPGAAPCIEDLILKNAKKPMLYFTAITDAILDFPGSTISVKRTGKTVVKVDWGLIQSKFAPETYEIDLEENIAMYFEPMIKYSGRLVKIRKEHWDITEVSKDKRWLYVKHKNGSLRHTYVEGVVMREDWDKEIKEITLYHSEPCQKTSLMTG